MMGLGYLGGGGSSSSNLSPLAPPFTVDRSNHRPNSNPVPHFNDPSNYAVPFSSSSQNWPYSHSSSSRPDYLADSTRTTTIPSVNDYGYLSSEPINPASTTTQWSALNSSVKTGLDSSHWSTVVEPSPKAVTDSFSYLNEAKPYYHPYVSPRIGDDIPLVALNEPSYDLLSSSGFVDADGSSQVDYTQSLSGLEYAPQWDSIWNGPAEGERGKRMETGDSFFSEDVNLAGSLAYKNYMNQGACSAETLSKGKEDSAMLPGNYADVVRRENHIGPSITEKLDGKSSLAAKNQRPFPIEFSKAPSYRAFPIFPESQPQASSPEPPKETWNNPKSYTLYEKRFQMFDVGLNDRIPATKSSPGRVIKPPSVVTTFPARGKVSSKNVEISNIEATNSNPSKGKEPHWSLGSDAKEGCLTTNQLSFQLGRNDHHTMVADAKKDGLDQALKSRSGYQVLDLNVPDVNSSLTVKSAANSSSEYIDHHNPAEDSPCWKGAPTSHFFPFESLEAVTPQHPMRKLQTSNGMNFKGSHIDRPCNDSPKVLPQQLFEKTVQNESTFVDNGFSLSPKGTPAANRSEKEHKSGDAVNAGFVGSSKRVQSSRDVVKPKYGYGLLGESNSDANSKTCRMKLPSLEEDVLTSKRKLQLQDGVVEHAIHAVENDMLSSVEDVAKPATAAKMNVHMLVKAMHDLSELLLFHCSNDVCALKEQDQETLDHVIGNLDVCMSRKIPPVIPTQKFMLPEQGTSNVLGEGACATKSQVTDEAAASSHGQVNNLQSAHDEKRNLDITGKKVDEFQGFVSLRDVADLSRDHNMVQAIKKVLDENLECKEELQTQTCLYKNLWLEAEAELCSISYKARFDRMKREIEKCKSDKATDVSENTLTIEKPSNSNISPDPNVTHKLTLEADGSQIPNTQVQESPLSSPENKVDDVEAAVMARFHILKCRGESNSINMEDRELAEVADANLDLTHLEFNSGKDDAVLMHNRMQNQFGSGWYNNASYTSSDWEHVLKDEYACQTEGHLS